MVKNTSPATSSGSQPPSGILRALAMKKAASGIARQPNTRTATGHFHFHTRIATASASAASTSIAPVTARP
jgi:hypothetical protein